MLQFADELVDENNLEVGTRLLHVLNIFFGVQLAADLIPGADYDRESTNILSFVAEFLSDDLEDIEKLKSEITEDEWLRTPLLADEYVERFGHVARGGRPTYCVMPAAPDAPAFAELS